MKEKKEFLGKSAFWMRILKIAFAPIKKYLPNTDRKYKRDC